jgi:hypothetical protein
VGQTGLEERTRSVTATRHQDGDGAGSLTTFIIAAGSSTSEANARGDRCSWAATASPRPPPRAARANGTYVGGWQKVK